MMHLVYTPYIIPMLVAAVLTAALSVHIWRRHSAAPGATALALLMLALTEWLVAEALCIVNADLSTRLITAKVEYLGIASVPVIWLVFALQYTGRQGWLTRRRLALLAICPAITLLMVWTNEAHSLIWAEFNLHQHGVMIVSEKTYGAWFWVQVTYSYALLFTGAVLVIRSAISSFWLYRRQASIIMIGMLVPTVGNAVYISHFSSVQGIDPTPLAFTVSGLMLALGLFRFRLLDIVPVARDTIIKEMIHGLIVLDSQNRIVDMNSAAERITGSTAPELIGQPVVQILSFWPDLTEHHGEIMEAQSEVVLGEGVDKHYYDLRMSPLYGRRGSVTGRVIILHDITARKQEEEKRSRFITMLTHELRTPLTPILVSGSVLVEQLEPKGGDEFMLARNILKSARSLNDRLSELLELVKGETGFLKVNLTPLEPERLIRGLASECSAMFAAKKQEFHLGLEELMPAILADEQRTSQVLLNLLYSANKFTPEGGQVVLRARSEENALVIEVEDTGPGIPLEEQQDVFQLYSHSDKSSGLAFHLALSKQLIELQGGKIWYHSQPGKGSTFGFTLPLAVKET